MAYSLKKPTGSFGLNPIPVVDNQINKNLYDSNSNVGVQLVGRNAIDYGEPIAQNIVQMVSNFAGSVTPKPDIALQGQLWFQATNESSGRLYVRKSSLPPVSPSPPTPPTQADDIAQCWAELATTTSNVASATKLQTPRAFSVSGDATTPAVAPTFDGTTDLVLPVILNTVNPTPPAANSFVKITSNGKGLVTATSAVAESDILPLISTTLSGTYVLKAGDTMTGPLTLNGTPTQPLHAVTKQYADNIAAGLIAHQSCRTATSAVLAGTVTYANGASGVGATLTTTADFNSIGGYTTSNGDRILVKNQVAQETNGIYTKTSATVLTRATDFDNSPTGEIEAGSFTFISNGTLAGTNWTQITPAPITVGTSPIVFAQISGPNTLTAGTGISIAGNVVTNTGVTSALAGTNISVSGATGAVTISVTGTVANATNAVTSGTTNALSSTALATSNTWTGANENFTSGNRNILAPGVSIGGLGVWSGGNAAGMSFYVPSPFAPSTIGVNMGLDTDNVFRIGGFVDSSVARMQLDQFGAVIFRNNVTAFSDERLKTDILRIENAIDKVSAIRGVTYIRKDINDGKRYTGVIAQELETVLPEAVSEADGFKTVAYGNMAGLFIEAIKELNAKIQMLQNEIRTLRK